MSAGVVAWAGVSSIGWQPGWWDTLTSGFMLRALAGGTIVALAAGIIGYFVIVRRTAFAAHALAHIGLPGATGAVLVGIPVTLGLAIFTIGGALAIGAMGKKASEREVATGTVLAFASGLGLLFNAMATSGTSTLTNVLFGNLLAITPGQLLTFTVFLAAVALAIAVIFRPLLFASIDAEVAEARGVPVKVLGTAFMVLMALVVTMAVQVVGTLLLFALVVTPSACAIMITARPGRAVALGAAISVVSVWVGLVLSAMFNAPASFFVVTVACAVWLVVRSVHSHRHNDSVD